MAIKLTYLFVLYVEKRGNLGSLMEKFRSRFFGITYQNLANLPAYF
jgi:hypothetical protein